MEQLSFDPDKYESAEAAKKARDVEYRKLKEQGADCSRWVLKNQQRGYSGFGTSRDMSVRDVYMINVYWKQTQIRIE